MPDPQALATALMAGDARALARACRMVDDRLPGFDILLRALGQSGAGTWVIGVTGSPGVGKSSLIARLIDQFLAQGERVAVVAVDPSSPFGGGALLGDRVRMQRHADNPDVFVRSLATRGAVGGLTRSAAGTVRLMSAWGAQVVLLETVGVGQDELDVCRAAQTTLVVLAPGLGDEVQALKAGVLEIGDVFAVNKCDRADADRTALDLEAGFALSARPPPPVVKVSASTGEGMKELLAALSSHRAWLASAAGIERQRERTHAAIEQALRFELAEQAFQLLSTEIGEAVSEIEKGELDLTRAASQLIAKLRGE